MWLEVEVLDSTGAVVSGSARFDPVSGEVEEDAQARLYQVKLGQTGESGAEPSFHFVLNDVVLEDTRIPPAGFVPPEDRDMAPIGRDYADGMGGYRNYDEQSYDLVACGSGELTLRARLRYQSTTREYIEFLRDHAPDSADPALMGESWGDVAYRGWMTHGGSEPVDVATVTASLGASPRACPVEMDAGMEVDAGAAVDAGSAPPPASGCSCRVGAAPSPTPALLSLGALAAVLLSRRRRR